MASGVYPRVRSLLDLDDKPDSDENSSERIRIWNEMDVDERSQYYSMSDRSDELLRPNFGS